MRPLLLSAATLLPGGGDWLPRPGVDVLVVEDKIAALGPGLAAPEGAELLDASRLLLMPAFVNAHTHSPEALARGRAPMARLDDWLRAAYAEGQDALDAAAITRAVRLTAAENILGGAVAVTDHFRQLPLSVPAVHLAAAAWAETGLRVRLAAMLRDLPSPSAEAAPATEEALAVAATLARDPPRGVVFGLGPSAPQRCSDALLAGLARLAREHGHFLHLHLCETALDRQRCLARFGPDLVAQLAALGLAGPDVEFAHGVHLTDQDLDQLARAGTLMVHNPVANLRLGSGIAPVARALARGVRLAVGTDGAGSNDTQDMLEAAKLACLLPRAGRPDEEWLSPEAVLSMATGGAHLRPGAAADLIAFSLDAPAFAQARPEELAARLLLAARPRDLRHVIAGGVFLLREGRLISPTLAALAG
ncbi:MAG: amidohydrolase family protein [Rhodovarius sp.]|nr:amidohydrolase family protein [Rhodovarius sp.]MCX7932940.1 amidohydrolase family protein [Rhodovarius sp.]MDW8316156.1 amidohydrolase family protein [Rhodovarius sp.]